MLSEKSNFVADMTFPGCLLVITIFSEIAYKLTITYTNKLGVIFF